MPRGPRRHHRAPPKRLQPLPVGQELRDGHCTGQSELAGEGGELRQLQLATLLRDPTASLRDHRWPSRFWQLIAAHGLPSAMCGAKAAAEVQSERPDAVTELLAHGREHPPFLEAFTPLRQPFAWSGW